MRRGIAIAATACVIGGMSHSAPINDLFEDSELLLPTGSGLGSLLILPEVRSTIGATRDTEFGGSDTGLAVSSLFPAVSGAGIWFSFYGNGLEIPFTTCGLADFDTMLHVFTGNGTNDDLSDLTVVAANDDDFSCIGGNGSILHSTVFVPTSEGELYHLLVSGFLSSNGDFRFLYNEVGARPTPVPIQASLLFLIIGLGAFRGIKSIAARKL